jgi:hypothetical protein
VRSGGCVGRLPAGGHSSSNRSSVGCSHLLALHVDLMLVFLNFRGFRRIVGRGFAVEVAG